MVRPCLKTVTEEKRKSVTTTGRRSHVLVSTDIKDVYPAETGCMFVFTALVFRPIQGQKKTFEELLEEQLKLEERRLKTAEQQVREYNRTHE